MTRVGCVGGLTLDWVRSSSGTQGPDLGGNALYSAVGVWMVGAQASLCAVVGSDFPLELLDRLEQFDIDLTPLRHIPGPSFRVMLDESGPQRVLSYIEPCGHNDTLDPEAGQVRGEWDVAHVAAIPTSSQRRLAAALLAFGVPFTLDTIVIPGEIEPDAAELVDLAGRSLCFLPSRQELDQLWPGGDLRHRVGDLAATIGRPVVVTLGADGSIGCDGDQVVRVPAFATEVVDSTGAGDTYCGAYAASYAGGSSMGEAMADAAAAASRVIESRGAEHVLTPDSQSTVLERAARLREATIIEELVHVVEQ